MLGAAMSVRKVASKSVTVRNCRHGARLECLPRVIVRVSPKWHRLEGEIAPAQVRIFVEQIAGENRDVQISYLCAGPHR